MKTLNKFFKFWFPIILWAGMIFYFSGKPRMDSGLEDLPSGMLFDFILRKVVHVFEYFILTFLLFRAVRASFDLKNKLIFIYPGIISFLYAISDEYHQSFVPGRSACVRDVFIDSIGIVLFLIVVFNLKFIKSKEAL